MKSNIVKQFIVQSTNKADSNISHNHAVFLDLVIGISNLNSND